MDDILYGDVATKEEEEMYVPNRDRYPVGYGEGNWKVRVPSYDDNGDDPWYGGCQDIPW